MPLTSSERGKAFREKRKNDPEFKQKEKIRQARKRDDIKHDVKRLTNKIANNRKRAQAFRDRAKLKLSQTSDSQTTSSTSTPYSSKAGKMKAVYRVKNTLPNSPEKRKAVLQELAESVGLCLVETSAVIKNGRMISSVLRESVLQFFNRDDISRVMPGKRDVKIIRIGKEKTKKQIRHLQYTLKEAHGMYVEDNPTLSISFSKFAALRPHEILLFRQMPENVCVCKLHENFIFLVNALSTCCDLPSYHKDWIAGILVFEHEGCQKYSCDSCLTATATTLLRGLNVENPEDQVTYYQWENADKVLQKSTKVSTIQHLFEVLLDKVPAFIRHSQIKRHQSSAYETDKKKAYSQPGHLVIQTDFAENFNCKHQDEIQSAYWGHKHLSLFTCCVWQATGMLSFTVVSENTEHSRDTVCIFTSTILDTLVLSECKSISFWSDGPSSQYKNRYIYSYLPVLKDKYNLDTISWNFFAAGHGKGPVDGIGGTAKRLATECVMRRSHIVQSSGQFAKALSDRKSSIKILVCDDVNSQKDHLNLETLFANSPAVLGIHASHHWHISKDGQYNCPITPSVDVLHVIEMIPDASSTPIRTQARETPAATDHHVPSNVTSFDSFDEGSLCIVDMKTDRGNTRRYLGQVIQCDGDQMEIQFCKPDPIKKYDFVLVSNDTSWVDRNNISKVRHEPIYCRRNHFQFNCDILL